MSVNGIYLLINYIKSVLWRVAKRLSYIEDARCLKVNSTRSVKNKFRIFASVFFFYGWTALVGLGLLIVEDQYSHSDTPHSAVFF